MATGGPQGRYFVTAFLENGMPKVAGHFKLFLIGYHDATSITVTIPKSKFREVVALHRKQVVTVQLPSHVQMVGTNIFPSTVVVKSSKLISVMSLNSKETSTETTIVYPLFFLGKKYFVITPTGHPTGSFQEFAVVACQQATNVDIYLRGQVTFKGQVYPAGSKLHVSLKPFQTIQLQSTNDLSGTKVLSQKPVAVLAGHTCIWSHNHCQHVMEQLLPVSQWGKTFAVVPLSFQSTHAVAFVVAHQATLLQIQAGPKQKMLWLQAGEVKKLAVKLAKPLYLTADAGIQVIFYSLGSVKAGVPYEPFLSQVPALRNYAKSYYVLGRLGIHNMAIIITKSYTTGQLTFDHQPLRQLQWQPIPGSGYSWAEYRFSRKQKVHVLKHPGAPFGVLSIGIADHITHGTVAFANARKYPSADGGQPKPRLQSGSLLISLLVCAHSHPLSVCLSHCS